MPTSKGLIGSSPKIDRLLKMINDYFYRDDLILAPEKDIENCWRVISGKDGKILSAYEVKLKKGRYRFELINH